MRKTIQGLLDEGIYDPREIFNRLYPTYNGHYARLRDLIAEVKNADRPR